MPRIAAGYRKGLRVINKKSEEKKLKIAVRVDPEDFAKLEILRERRFNVSEVLRGYIKEGLEREFKKKEK